MKNFITALITLLLVTIGQAQQKYGFVDTKYILEAIPEYKSAQQQLDRLAENWQKEIEAMQQEIEKMRQDYQAESILLTDDMKKKREDKIVKKDKEIRDLQKQRYGKDGDLMKRRQELVKPIQDRIFTTIKVVSEKKNYSAVFDINSDLTILYINPKNDISDEILKEMGYAPDKNAPKSINEPTGTTKPKTGTAPLTPQAPKITPNK